MYNLVTVPLYDTLGQEAIVYIIQQTQMPVIVATKDKVKLLLQFLDQIPSLKKIIAMDGTDAETVAAGEAGGVEVFAMSDLEKEGAESPASPVAPTSEDIATICYTSGTTGLPKGVVLLHRNFLGFVGSALGLMNRGQLYNFNKDDVYISYLPLAHVFERSCQQVIVNQGARVGYFQGDTLKLLDDVAELKPTVFPSVPRLYNRIYDKVMAGVRAKGGLAQMLFNMAYAAKKQGLENGTQSHWLWDTLVFAKVRARLGGNVKMMMTGAAPISADVIDFLRIAFGAEVYEGYGQTENAAGMTVVRSYSFLLT